MTIFADATDYTVQADGGNIESWSTNVNFTLVDEEGNILVDEEGNILVSEEATTTYGEVVYADGTDYTIEA